MCLHLPHLHSPFLIIFGHLAGIPEDGSSAVGEAARWDSFGGQTTRCRTDLSRESVPPGKNSLHYGPSEEIAKSSRAETKRIYQQCLVTCDQTWKIAGK